MVKGSWLMVKDEREEGNVFFLIFLGCIEKICVS